jgi:triacylglycerol lipase
MPMNPAAAVSWGSFVQAAYDQYASDPGQANPAAIMNMPAGYTLVRTIQMTDFLGPVRSRVFYGFVAAGGDPQTAVVALRGTVGAAEWWDDLHWDLVPFAQVPDGGKVARGFSDIYSTYGTMIPGQPQGARAPATFAADVAHAAASGLGAGLDPALPAVVCGHSLGGALATLLVADLAANTPLKPQAWTFASPRVGDAEFAGRYGGLSTVSWRIYNQADIVPYFPVDAAGSYQPVTAGYAINSLGKAKWSLRCAHALSTYLHVLSPATVPLNPACTLTAWQPVTALPPAWPGAGRTAHVTSRYTAGPIRRATQLARAHARPPGTGNARSCREPGRAAVPL